MGFRFSGEIIMQFRTRTRPRVIRILTALVAVAAVSAACAPPSSPTGPRDPEIEALLKDPEFVAQFGESDEEREKILTDIRRFLDDWKAWDMDPAELERMAAEKAAHDKAVAEEERLEQERADREAAAEAERLAKLQNGPTLEEIADSLTDGSEDFDDTVDAGHWAEVEGFKESLAGIASLRDRQLQLVKAAEDRLRREGTLEEFDRIVGWVPPEGEGDPMFAALWEEAKHERNGPATGACLNRDGNRAAPAPALRPGTIYTPYQNTHAHTTGSPTYTGQLRTVIIDGRRHMIVEGHLGNLDAFGISPGWGSIQTLIRVRLSIHTPGNIVSNYDGIGPFMQLGIPGTSPQSGRVFILCYTDDHNLPTGSEIRRAMFRAFIPMDPGGAPLPEPGFQVRAAVSELQDYPTWFYGADMRTVFLGRQPLGYNSTFTNGGFGVTLGRGVVIDDNNITGDDLESTIRTPVRNAITNALSGLDGTSTWVLGKKNANSSWGWFGFHINNSNPTTPNVDIDWVPTVHNWQLDDEHRLKGSVSMNDWLIEGYMSLPWAAAGLIPCYFRMKVNWSASIYAAVDIHDTARTILQPDIEVGPVTLNVHSMFASPLPLGCNSIYLFKFADKWLSQVQSMMVGSNQAMSGQVQTQPNIQNAVPANIPIGGGHTMQSLFAGWNDTCIPYGCNGHRAGDMAMSWAGLEATGDIRFTDTLPAGSTRRFPVSHSPTTGGTANDRVRVHFGPQNEITDFSAWINPTVLNQALRVMAEHGRLDLAFDPSTPGTAKSPPVYLATPLAADKPLGLFLPHLELDPAGPNLFAMDAFVAIGVGFDTGTRKLVPAPVSPSDPGFGIALWTLNCDGTLWAVCAGVPALASNVLNWAANSLLDPLLQNSIGQVTVPQTGNMSLTGVKILNEDGHLGVRASVGAAQLRAWGDINASTYGFDSFWEGLPGTGPVTYTWSIKDNVSNQVIFTNTGTQHQFGGFPTPALTPMNLPFSAQKYRSATATISASRGGTTKTATHTLDIIF